MISVATAFAYFILSHKTGFLQRLAPATHSICLFLAAVCSVVLSGWNEEIRWGILALPFWLLLVCFLIGLIYAVRRFDGNRVARYAQVVQVPSALCIWFVGTMVITGDWM